ncbi:protein translocase subunit SecF [Patescibacteria group bacterium]|nr:protein translocase subunit SecF [Patescibacteria group bacterium]
MYFAFIKYRKIFYIVSFFLSVAAVASIFLFGLKLGIDFTGGSSLELAYKNANEVPSVEIVRQTLSGLDLGEISLQKKGDKGFILKMKNISEENHQEILKRLGGLAELEQGSESFQMIGPIIGQEMKGKTIVVIFLALLAILLYVTLSFRRVTRPVKSYVYGIAGIIALGHDVLVPLGVLAFLGKLQGCEITIPIVVAFLTIFGYSISDSIVVFDRTRENLLKAKDSSFAVTVEKSLNETLARCFNTALTVLLVLFAMFFLGDPSLKYFSLTLIIGISCGVYSSIFLASPLLVTFQQSKTK